MTDINTNQMAQAARLNLRMQKELKLLLVDPPHGASFPFLSPNSDVSSSFLSIIDAQIKGPEGTVYANGLFNMKIQIPERYPFQPPSVTFATPIYHPNIDNGGRICLDILNLPPKGAWQPSLNISSVLTSIGLLLSEPNPDDGLMCEASREYKYNRQAFDQKARLMNEKYAQPGAIGKICGSHLTESPSNSNMMEVETTDNDLKQEANKYVVSHKKIYKKLSLESLGTTHKRDDYVEGNEASNGLLFLSKSKNRTEVEGTKSQLEYELHKFNWSQEKLSGNRRKLSLEASSQSQKNDGEENAVPNHHLSHTPQDLYVASFGPPLVPQVGNSYKLELQQCEDNKSVDDNINMRPKKPRGICQDQPLGSLEIINGGKEKMNATTQLLPSETHSNTTEASSRLKALNQIQVQPRNDLMGVNCKKLCLVGKRLSLGCTGSSETQEKDNRENMEPLHTKPLLHSSSSSADLSTTPTVSEMSEDHKRGSGNGVLTESLEKYGTGRKLSLGLQAQFQERNNNNIQPLSYSLSLSADQSEPVPLHECKEYQKQHSDEDRNDIDTSAGEIKRQETEKTETSEAVIVLDSEDSEEERVVSARSKSLLTRKRIGKWKLRP